MPTTVGAREARGARHEEILGHVLEQHADVERPGPPPREQRLRALAAGLEVLAPAVALVLEHQGRRVVLGAGEQQLPHRHERAPRGPDPPSAPPASPSKPAMFS